METRSVRQTGKADGDIVSLCNSAEPSWSPRTKADAIADIESGEIQYVVGWASGATVIRVVDGPHGKYLRTDRDNSPTNNLDDLPDC